jgi:FKBP-type peptidyl-prolyl cis-trans isomerase FklB
MKIQALLAATAAVLALTACTEQPSPPAATEDQASQPLASDAQRMAYAVGMQYGREMSERHSDLDAESLMRGVRDAVTAAPAAMTPEEVGAALESYRTQLEAESMKLAQKHLDDGKSYRDANRQGGEFKELETGIQYKVLQEGAGEQPKAEDTVAVHYRGTHVNGEEFDSSYSRGEPTTFPVAGVIQGWQEVLPLMKVGSKWQVVVPPEFAYGETGAGGVIAPNETLVFEIELLEIK